MRERKGVGRAADYMEDACKQKAYLFFMQTWHLETFCLRSCARMVCGCGLLNMLFESIVLNQKLRVGP